MLSRPAAQRPRGRSAAFTLIELLVVIAIIAILAAILFPVFAQAREKARQTACLSNTKQIGTGLMMYIQDYDETHPGVWFGPSGWSTPSDATVFYKWMDAIYPYIKNEQLFNCPSDSVNTKYSFRNKDGKNGYGSYAMSNAYHATGDAYTGPSSDYGGNFVLSAAAVQNPAGTIWIADGGVPLVKDPAWKSYEFWWDNVTTANNIKPTTTNPRSFQNIIARHSEMVNTVYCDGHAKAGKIDSLIAQKTVGTVLVRTNFTIEDD
jgi:prepilin-type N-terminal cleavage/methylation domain-containing protein/prepilin-type processing-associated H-X9-DG protein